MLNTQDIVLLIKRTLNKIDARLVDHGHRVAYCMMKCLESLDYSKNEIRNITMTCLLHDIGAYKTENINNIFYFEEKKMDDHAKYGYLFYKHLSPLYEYAPIILYHHTSQKDLEDKNTSHKESIALIHLIDRIDVYWQEYKDIKKVKRFLAEYKGDIFSKWAIDVFMQADSRYHILETVYEKQQHLPLEIFDSYPFSKAQISHFVTMISFAIDFRSHFMVAHTIIITGVATRLAKIMEFNDVMQEKIYYGALLHDIGKVAIPVEILDNPGKLTRAEMTVMQKHVSYTIEILDGCIASDVVSIAGRHHEKLDGTGYPYGLHGDVLSKAERLVAIADIFSALIGQRSYKEGYSKERITEILLSMANHGSIDKEIVNILLSHYDEIDYAVKEQCQPIIDMYKNMDVEYYNLMKIN